MVETVVLCLSLIMYCVIELINKSKVAQMLFTSWISIAKNSFAVIVITDTMGAWRRL